MVKHGWICLIVGGLLSIPVAIQAGTFSESVLIAVSLVLALGPFLIAFGYDALADRSGGGLARSFLQVGSLGLLILGGTEIAMALLPLAGNARAGEQIHSVYLVGAGLVVIGALVAGLALVRRWMGVAIPLLASAVALCATLIPQVQHLPGYLAWAVATVILGVALRLSR